MKNKKENVILDDKNNKQLEAFRKARGIWKDRSDIDAIYEELDERWKQWGRDLDKMIEHWHNHK
jgi:hypothetical protein